MSKELTQPGARIDAKLWEQFRNDVIERTGRTRGAIGDELENAIREYLNGADGGDTHDRLRRLENEVEQISENIERIADNGVNTNKDSDVGTRTEKRLNKIEDRIHREAGPDADRVHESFINNAIEDIAGTSRVTLNRYKEMLQQRHIAFEWPAEGKNSWWINETEFVKAIEQTQSQGQVTELREKYGTDWWDAQRSQIEEDVKPGYQ